MLEAANEHKTKLKTVMDELQKHAWLPESKVDIKKAVAIHDHVAGLLVKIRQAVKRTKAFT